MVKSVIPILCKIIGDANDEESPPERHPMENISRSRQNQGQHFQTEVSEERPHDDLGKGKANNVSELLVAIPAVVVVKAQQKFAQP